MEKELVIEVKEAVVVEQEKNSFIYNVLRWLNTGL